jgi:glycosyltransferase involved in cell wall biosynthesis
LLNQKDSQIGQLSAEKDSQIAAHVREQERLAGQIGQLSAEKDSQIAAHVREQERLAGQIAGYVRQQERLAGQIGQLSAEVQRQGRMRAEGDRLAARLQEEKEKLESDLQKQQSQVHEIQQSLMREREAGRKELDEKEDRIASLEAIIRQREATLSHIYSSHGWKILTAYYDFRNKALPVNTKRRELAGYLWQCLWKIVQFTPSRPPRGATIVTRHSPAVFTSRNFGRALKHAKTFGVVETYQKVREKLAHNGYAPQSRRSTTVGLIPIEPTVINGENVPKEEVTVSVVIPTKNGGEDFRRALATIANQKGFRKVETIVVDSGSTDKTVELAEQFGAKIIKILPEEFSHSYARNLGASYASGEYLLFTVQDALPPSDLWLYELFSVIKHNDVVAVSCAEFPWESADLFYRAITWNHYRFLEVDREDRIMRYAGSEDHVTLRKNGQLSDLACLISKDVFTKYKYQTDYGEDLDLGLRLIKDGYEIAFLGSTRIIHSHNRSAYYYLKRGYVENVFLPRIFSDYPTVGDSLERVIPDVLVTHQVIKSMVEETWDLQFPCKTAEFSKGIIKRFRAASGLRLWFRRKRLMAISLTLNSRISLVV